MTQTTHTPGPWVLDETVNGWTLLAGGGEITADHFDCSEGDARLIAAAPELLAALEDMIAVLEFRGAAGPAMDSAKAAIAKAKGE